jgi:hypothetical protein
MVSTRSCLSFRIPASTVIVELWQREDEWSLAYLGLTSEGLEVVDDAPVNPGEGVTDVGLFEIVEARLRAVGRSPMRIKSELVPPLMASWKI